MRNLMRKEIIFARKRLVTSLVFITIYLACFSAYIDSHRVYLALAGFMGSLMMPINIFSADDRNKVAMLTCSLPFSRRTIVLAKHVVAWALMLAVVVIAAAVALANPYTKFPAAPLLTIQSAFQAILFMSIISALIFPFVVRFGYMGVIVFLVATQVLGIVFFGVAMLTHRMGNPLGIVMNGVEGSIRALMHSGRTAPELAVMIAAAVGLSVISLGISQMLFARRDL